MDIAELVSKATDVATVGRVFGPSRESAGTVIVPVAWVVSAGGGGGGEAVQPPAETPESQVATGGGGGFAGIAWPLGVYAVTGDDVRWVPALDATRLAIAALAIVRLLLKRRARPRVR